MHGKIRARRPLPRGCSFVSVGETRSAAPPSRHSRDGLFPQAISVISLFSPRCPMGVSTCLFLLLFRSLARSRERVTRCTLSLYRENHLGCCFAGRRWWERRRRRRYGVGYRMTSSATRNYRVPSDVYLIRCDVVYAIAALRIYVASMCVYIYIMHSKYIESKTHSECYCSRWEHCDVADMDQSINLDNTLK